MPFTDAQDLFALFFVVYFSLVIDRSHQMYKPWDTYKAWKGDAHNTNRLILSWATLFIVPLLHFSILFVLLGAINIRFDAVTVRDVLSLVLIGFGSFFEFGYFRIYEAFLHRYAGSFFSGEELERMVNGGKIRPDFRAHFIPGALYVAGSTVMILLSIALLT